MVMKVIHYHLDEVLEIENQLAMAIGFFDGVHQGHLTLINEVLNYAKKNHTQSALMTFYPSPLVTLGIVKEEHYLTSPLDRQEILEKLGVDYLIIVDFSKEVSQLLPEVFFEKFITSLPLKYLVCGFDYHFGLKGQGNAKMLQTLAKDRFEVYVQDEVVEDDKKISSTRIRLLLDEGNIEKVNHLLSRVYRIQGTVIKGRQIGRTIGFPTANIDYGHYFIPKNGVYGVKLEVNGKMYIGMCNIGYNPTFDKLDHPSLEVNIFDFDEDIYHQNAKVYFYCFIRDEVKFSSPNDLVKQLLTDKEKIIRYFNR